MAQVAKTIALDSKVFEEVILYMEKDNRPNFSNAMETLAKLQIEQLKKEGRL